MVKFCHLLKEHGDEDGEGGRRMAQGQFQSPFSAASEASFTGFRHRTVPGTEGAP